MKKDIKHTKEKTTGQQARKCATPVKIKEM